MTVIDFVQLTRRSWRALVIFIVLGVGAMAVFTATQPRIYEATSAGFVVAAADEPETDSAIGGTSPAAARAQAYVTLISTTPVFVKISQDPTIDLQGQTLEGRLSAEVAPGSTMITVSATASTPDSALTLANGALKALASVINDIETQASSGQPALIVIALETAVRPDTPVSPKLTLNLAIGAAGGLVAGYLFLFVRRGLDARIRSSDDLPELTGVGMLGLVPKVGRRRLSVRSGERDNRLAAEAIRQVRTGLSFASVDSKLHSIAVVSANQSEGKTTVATSLAQVFAQSGRRTLIIDADLRRSSVAEELGIDGSVGLSELLSGQVDVTHAIRPTDNPELFVLPAGRTPPNPSEMLGSAAFRSLVEDMSQDHFVIVDSAPVLPVTDAALVSVVVDGVVFVVAAGKTRKPEITAARRILEQVNARTLGFVLNMVPLRGSESSYYEYYGRKRGYDYLADAKDEPRAGRAIAIGPESTGDEVPSTESLATENFTTENAAGGRNGAEDDASVRGIPSDGKVEDSDEGVTDPVRRRERNAG